MIIARHPVCAVCGVRPAIDVDHITPLEAGGEDTIANLQGLCRQCHGRKTRRESRG
jgi:5-methylcytosine-specific restriction protein A